MPSATREQHKCDDQSNKKTMCAKRRGRGGGDKTCLFGQVVLIKAPNAVGEFVWNFALLHVGSYRVHLLIILRKV